MRKRKASHYYYPISKKIAILSKNNIETQASYNDRGGIITMSPLSLYDVTLNSITLNFSYHKLISSLQ